MFYPRFLKVDKFSWWDMERIQTDDGMQFSSKEFQEGLSVCGVRLELVAPHHQEKNGQVEVIWRKLRTIAHLIMVHVRVYDKYIHLALM